MVANNEQEKQIFFQKGKENHNTEIFDSSQFKV